MMEEWAQERQTAKQHQIHYFPSWAARWKKKSIKTSSEDLLSVCIPTERACGRGNHTDEKTVP